MPAPTPALARSFMEYKGDDGNTYQIATTVDNIDAQSGTAEDEGVHPPIRKGWKPRGIYGNYVSDSIKYRTFVPIGDPTVDLWIGTADTFEKASVTWVVAGKRGEDRFVRGGPAVAPS